MRRYRVQAAIMGLAVAAATWGVIRYAAPRSAPPTQAGDPCAINGQIFCALNPQVTDATATSTICVAGWTASVRPAAAYTAALKAQQMAALRLVGGAGEYEEDHRVPLELGGDPSAATNLTPQKRAAGGGNAEAKDRDESSYRRTVCSGRATLLQAQREFVAKWLGPWPTYRQ